MNDLFDAMSYIMGHAKGKVDGAGNVTFEGDIICTDQNNDGNVVIVFTEE